MLQINEYDHLHNTLGPYMVRTCFCKCKDDL